MSTVTINLHRGTLSLARQFAIRCGLAPLWEKGLGDVAQKLIEASPIPGGEIPPADLVEKIFMRQSRRRRIR